MSDEQPQDPAPRCIHLSCKSMAVYGEAFEQDPDYQAGMVDFTCVATSKAFGPDGGEASMEMCRNRGRTCYCEF